MLNHGSGCLSLFFYLRNHFRMKIGTHKRFARSEKDICGHTKKLSILLILFYILKSFRKNVKAVNFLLHLHFSCFFQ
jgi:hypothetical protein